MAAARSRSPRSTKRGRPTRCALSIDGYDPAPGRSRRDQPLGARDRRVAAQPRSAPDDRAARASACRRRMRGEIDISKCLAEASDATMTILHLVHEGSADDLAARWRIFRPERCRAAGRPGKATWRRAWPIRCGWRRRPGSRGRRARSARRRRRPAALSLHAYGIGNVAAYCPQKRQSLASGKKR